ncbi:MAG: hypothetical protein BroJett013_16110 [Alphaproteobacteria bacterium]|nr:MAG: hypothetical protein BroJett013_16110 [Alphaproteobacteria bacterium]
MNDDRELADLLGRAPPASPDPVFRFDVFARVTERARRREAVSRALNQVAAYAAVGLAFPVARAAGLDWPAAQPVLLAGGAVAAAAAVALVTILGPRSLLHRWLALLRGAF